MPVKLTTPTLYERFLARYPRGWHGHRFTVYGVDPPEGPEVRTVVSRACSSGRDCDYWTCEAMTQPPERIARWRARIIRDAERFGCSREWVRGVVPTAPEQIEWAYYKHVLRRGRRIFGQDWGKIID